MKVLTTTPFLAGAPGDAVTCRVRIENDSHLASSYRLRVLGFDGASLQVPGAGPALPAGGVTELELELRIPDAIAPGNHAIGVEVRSDRQAGAGSVASVTVSVGSLDRMLLTVNPSTVRGHRTGRFWVDVLNRDREAVELELGGDAADGTVSVRPRVVRVEPNQRVRARGRVTGPVRLFGESRQLPFTVSAQGRSAPIYARATYQQRPLIPRSLRTLIAVLVVLGLWAGALWVGLDWWIQRGNEPEAAPAVELVDVDGKGTMVPADKMIDTDSDGVGDTPAAQVAAAVAAGEDPSGAGAPPTTTPKEFTSIAGTVKAGETGDNAGVTVTLTPLSLGEEASPGAVAFRGAEQANTTKLWPARYGVSAASGLSSVRQTETLTDESKGVDGTFLIGGVTIRQTYEVTFTKAGFDTQAFVVTPTPDGEPVQMEVELEPSDGSLVGQVTAGGVGLGNVEIAVTDGTVNFATTTDSEGSVGRFSLPAVSTPETYTITATRRGYGTQVVQVELGLDEDASVAIEMQPGVGSIIGRVSAGGAPLGGATLTVSNGDDTRTTTSLTDGDVGSYNFPQLEIPGQYTVTASAPGYLTQTRLVDLRGNATGADFDLVKTTGTITGVIASSAAGALPGATIEISRDNLSFTAFSAVSPEAGAFNVDDLPPGTYLVRMSRFDHAEASQLVTLTAGQVFDVGRVTLQFVGTPELPTTGSVNVNVVNSDNVALTGATVRLLDISTRDTIAEIVGTADQSTFIFQNVAVGTYVIQATLVPKYRVAETRVSVGLGPQSARLQMFLLGQASGRVVDSRTRQVLSDYAVQIWRVVPGPEVLVESVTPTLRPRENAAPEYRWESTANSLTTGVYEIRVVAPPPGYRVLGQELLQPGRPDLAPMRFEIAATADRPLDLNDILADKYPTLRGRIIKPLLITPTTNEIDFATAASNLPLTVTLDCPGATGPVEATVTDQIIDQGEAPGLDSYEVTPIQLQRANASGNCVIRVAQVPATPGDPTPYLPAAYTLDPPLVPSDGLQSPDQIVNIALIAPIDAIAGSVTWLDRGLDPNLPRPISGVTVATEGEVITGFERGQDATDPLDVAVEPIPVRTLTPLTSVTVGGAWRLDGQVFGQTTYSFSDPTRFETGRMTVTIDDTPPRTAIAANASLTVSDLNGNLDVQMVPLPGSISGNVDIVTVRDRRLSDLTISGDGPGTATATVSPDADANFVIDPADAGTWTLTTTADGSTQPNDPRVYSLLSGSSTVRTPLDPNADIRVADVEYVEHPRIDVQVVGLVGGTETDIAGATVTITGPAGPVTQSGGSGLTRFFPLPNAGLERPLYTWSVAADGYDLTRASVEVTVNGATSSTVVAGSAGGTLNVQAGAKPFIKVTLPKFGSITGSLDGVKSRSATSPTQPLTIGPGEATVVARRVGEYVGGRWVSRNDVVPLTASGNQFTVSGPPGAYVFDVSHPDFGPPIAFPPGAATCTDILTCRPDEIPTVLLGGATGFLMVNDADPNVLASPITMRIRTVDVHVRVVTDRTSMTAVGGASITLAGPDYTDVLDPVLGGEATMAGIVPGTNDLRATVRVAGADTHFPVVASLNVPLFSATGDGLVELVVVMPPLGNSITMTVQALNQRDRAVTVPAESVTHRYTVLDSEFEGGDLDNTATETAITPTPQPNPRPIGSSATPVSVTFDNIAEGLHDIEFSNVTAGYAAPSPNPRTGIAVADGIQEDLGLVTYRAANRAVTVTVLSDEPGQQPDVALTDAKVQLVAPDGFVYEQTAGSSLGVYTFPSVAVETVGNYTITITHPLHSSPSPSPTLLVAPGTGTVTGPTVVLVTANARISGTVRKDDTESAADGTSPIGTGGQVALYVANQLVAGPITPDLATGAYTFTFDPPSAADAQTVYEVRASLTGYTTESLTFSGVRKGRPVTGKDVTVLKLAQVTVNVTGVPPASTTLALTITSPATATGAVVTRTGTQFVITNLDPRVTNYRFSVSATGYYTQLVPAAGNYDPPIGSNVTLPTVALVDRSVTVVVSTSPADATAAAASTVTLTVNGVSFSPTKTANSFRFGAITEVGSGVVTISNGPNYRTRKITVNPSTAPVTLSGVDATIYRLVTVTGNLGTNGVGAKVTASSPGLASIEVTATSTTYSISGLGLGPDPFPNLAIWTLTAERLGYGAKSTTTGNTVDIDNDSTFIDDVRDLVLEPRDITVSFTVQSPAGTPLLGAVVSSTSQTSGNGTTIANGTATVVVTEQPTAYTWTVSAAGKITRTGTFSLSNLTPSVGPVVLVDRPTLAGVVSRNGTGQNGATVYLCRSSVTTCEAGTAVASTTTRQINNVDGSYEIAADADTWKIAAVDGNRSGNYNGTVEVNADGTVTPAGPYNVPLA